MVITLQQYHCSVKSTPNVRNSNTNFIRCNVLHFVVYICFLSVVSKLDQNALLTVTSNPQIRQLRRLDLFMEPLSPGRL